MGHPEIVDLCSDDEINDGQIKCEMPTVVNEEIKVNSSCIASDTANCDLRGSCLENQGNPVGTSYHVPNDLPRQISRRFWKAGEDFDTARSFGEGFQSCHNHMRIHPKFLHSNATSHKWAFGAIAELLDNAVDEVGKGATYVILDKIENLEDGFPALLIQDNGGGMSPESLQRCMSFGFSDKSNSSIGQYGNGFKTSTMRLGSDVIVFSRHLDKGTLTQTAGLLSYTFLKVTGADDIVVPMVNYEFDTLAGEFRRPLNQGEKKFTRNLDMMLKWSPFATESVLLEQFKDIGRHGTKAIVFNLWLNECGDLELDFDSDPKDIMIAGAPEIVHVKSVKTPRRVEPHLANKLHYSLRAYSSILYLHMPENFRIVLRGDVVIPCCIADELMFRECIKYKPHSQEGAEDPITTTIGFLKDAFNTGIHGFSVYHKNRLILPFWKVVSNTQNRGRCIVGVLETNFIKPTHDKQGFEKSILYQKLKARLREMTLEYWDCHCHLVGCSARNLSINQIIGSVDHVARSESGSGFKQVAANHGGTSIGTSAEVVTAPFIPPNSLRIHSFNATTQTVKREMASNIPGNQVYERLATKEANPAGFGNITWRKDLPDDECRRNQELKLVMQENAKLHGECEKLDAQVVKLLIKEREIMCELEKTEHLHELLLIELSAMNDTKVEKP